MNKPERQSAVNTPKTAVSEKHRTKTGDPTTSTSKAADSRTSQSKAAQVRSANGESNGVLRKQQPKTMTVDETEAYNRLDILTRRYYLTFLSNTIQDEPVRAIFPGMKSHDPIYKVAKKKVSKNYKNWKGDVLGAVAKFMRRWIKSAKQEVRAYREELDNPKDLRAELAKEFNTDWLCSVFKFANLAVDYDELESRAMRFPKCRLFATSYGVVLLKPSASHHPANGIYRRFHHHCCSTPPE